MFKSKIDFWQIIERFSAVVSLFGVPYLINDKRKHTSRFSFDFAGSSGKSFEKDGKEYYRFTFEGSIKNHSLEINTL